MDGNAHAGSTRQASYLREVLRLEQDETEDGLENTARALGLDVATLASLEMGSHSGKPVPSDTSRMSQESVGSRASQSTGFMSTFSDASREHHHQPAARAPYSSSLFGRDYDAFVNRGAPHGRESVSFSPPSTPSQSTRSLALSSPPTSPKRHFRRIRGLSMLRLGRSGSNTSLADPCPHFPQDPRSQQRAVHKLPCGHRSCTQALRGNIQTSSGNSSNVLPTCSSVPIPDSLAKYVMTQAELPRAEPQKVDATLVCSIKSGYVPLMDKKDSVALMEDIAIPPEEPQRLVENVSEQIELKQLRDDQAGQLDRFIAWTSKQKAELEAQQGLLREQLKARHSAALEELEEEHSAAMAEAEDKQVKAEADMRTSHDREKRDNVTALKYMEAYCAGRYSSGELHNRLVTAQDHIELDKTKRARERMDGRQESAINVLRGEQSRRMRLRAQRQEKEEQELQRGQRREELELERSFGQEMAEFENEIPERRLRLEGRWRLQAAVMTRQLAVAPVFFAGEEKVSSLAWQVEILDDRPVALGAAEEVRCETA
ncbi:hypothetical protein LTR02_000660 [Friedmanniomyces endolithicus]|nr:hypothetical protein LTR38_012556 [Friedmanniomyces endolithicus]KAK0800469.1 hypothetical protein LTR59_005738 [Friedmanniomyces endolithicus]KAK0807195.1 hypothetical protein LTR75_006700 [Friedmanniomyces endolithicus]KAK0841378.1 hypothetical protein LTS02_016860 [Friedmanniomyces endolithicus]KAK0845000.1 hypothetical protein LTR03_007682 [Friedmanniomyces endolithicus]